MVVIRVDASTTIGSGHVMRCLMVAKMLSQHQFNVRFWMLDLPGNMIAYVRSQGFATIFTPEKADLYIVDHYDIDERWESEMRHYAKKIMVIDDLANRKHDCDLLLDQNYIQNFQHRYAQLVPSHCVQLLGPSYLIMREEFMVARQQLRARTSDAVERLLVFMGGSDPTGETLKVIAALQNFHFADVDVVVGNGNESKTRIQRICEERGYHYHQQIHNMAELMQRADFSIGAGGSATWERCYVGLPSTSTIVAHNQIESTEFAAQVGAVWNLGWHENVTIDVYEQVLDTVRFAPSRIPLTKWSEVGLQLTSNRRANQWLNEILALVHD